MSRGSEPATLDDRLDALAGRVRRQRILRGISLSLLAAIFSAITIALLDSSANLSVPARCVLEALWVLQAITMTWRLVVRPWLEDPPVEEVAERMMADDSPNVVAALAREEKDHRAYPSLPTRLFAFATLLALFTSILAAASFGERVRRIALPWHNRAVLAPFEIVVVSGDAVARRGGPVTLSAYLKPNDANGVLPDSASLAIRGGDARPMSGANGAFHITLPAPEADFEYRVEAGPLASDWYAVRLADAVELAAGTRIAIAPPEYAAPEVKPSTTEFADVDALQHSTATFQLKFTRPAESAVIEWRPEGRNPFEAADVFPVLLAADKQGGVATVPLRASGLLRVVLVNESGPRRLRTETAIGVRVKPDAPPRFERIEGLSVQPRTVRPNAMLHIGFAARASHGIPSATVEYASAGASGTVPVLIEASGAGRIEGRCQVEVAPLAKEGGTLRLRIRIRDSRRLPELNLGPQETTYPPEGWFEATISSTASPFDEQQIIGQRDAVGAALRAAKERIAAEQAEVNALRKESEELQRKREFAVPLDHTLRLAAARERLRETRTLLDRTAAEAKLTASLQSVASRMQSLADGLLGEADDRLQQASEGDGWLRYLTGGSKALADALSEAERLESWNARLAQHRLDRSRLTALARDMEALEKSTAPSDVILTRQRELLAELKRITSASEPLTRASTALAGNESARLAAEVRTLAGRLHDLDLAAAGLSGSLRQTLLDELAAAQSELAKRIAGLAKGLEPPARLAAFVLPKPEDFERVAALLRQGKVVESLTESERLAIALEKLADLCDAWTADRADAKLAVAQFAKWQTDLLARWTADNKTPVVLEQKALLDAMEKLHMPATPVELTTLRDAILVHLRLAVRRLDSGAPAPNVPMKFAADALERLAAKLPTLQARINLVRGELDKLRSEQDTIESSTELALRTFDKLALTSAVMQNIAVKLGPVQIRQVKLADKLAALDLPNHERRQSKAVLAMRAAASDLKDGLPFDSVASLGAVRHELDRLKQALEGQIPADSRADALYAKQSEALALVLAAGDAATAKQWEPVIALQHHVTTAIGAMEHAAPEAPGLLADARKAAELAEFSLRDGSDFKTIVRRLRDSKDALALLAGRLNDRETERDRIKRLVSSRRTAECAAKKLAGKPPNREASIAAQAELDRELTELGMTRVGGPAQAARKKAFEMLFRLQNRPEPDRLPLEQRQLADALAEVAGLMASDVRLTTRPEAEAPAPDPVEEFLPSRKHSAALQQAARFVRELRDGVNSLAAVLVEKLKPAAENPFAPLEVRQRNIFSRPPREGNLWRVGFALHAAIAANHAADRLAVGDAAGALVAAEACTRWLNRVGTPEQVEAQESIRTAIAALSATSNMVAAQQQARHVALAAQSRELSLQIAGVVSDGDAYWAEAAERVRLAERLLTDAGRKGGQEAARLRAEAHELIAKCIPSGIPLAAATADPAGLAVREAERSMQRTIRELAAKDGIPASREAMIRTVAAIRDAIRALESEQ